MMREYRLRKKASKLLAEKARQLSHTLDELQQPVPTFDREGENAKQTAHSFRVHRVKHTNSHIYHRLQKYLMIRYWGKGPSVRSQRFNV